MRLKAEKSEAEALLVMRDKALDLGYLWDVSVYPTPAWAYVSDELGWSRSTYTEFLPHISKHVLDRVYREWDKACVQRAVPLIRLFVDQAPLAHAMPEDYYVAQENEEIDPDWFKLEYLEAAANQDERRMANLRVPFFQDTSRFLYRMSNVLNEFNDRKIVSTFKRMHRNFEVDCAADLARRIDAVAPWGLSGD